MSIPQPQKDEQGKIVGDFYPLQRAEILALRKNKLINNAAYVHLALRFENPFCDRPIEILPKEFALRWSIPESSVYEAIAKLKEAGAIEIKYGKVIIQWINSQENENIDSQQNNLSGNPESAQPIRIDSGFSETSLDSQKEFRNPRNNSEDPEKGIYKDRARSSDISDISDTANTAAAEKNEVMEEKEVASKPTDEELRSAKEEVRRLSPQIKINRRVEQQIIRYWANFPAALAATKEAATSGWKGKLIGLLLNELKNPTEDPKTAAIETKNFPPTPTQQQKEELNQLGMVYDRKIFDQRYPSVLCVHVKINGENLLWWEALELNLAELMRQQG